MNFALVIARKSLRRRRSNLNRRSGFTFPEVLVAMVIFVLCVVVAIDLIKGSVVVTTRSREATIANWLLQNIMTELETKIETLGFEQGCEEKAEAKFDAPYAEYRWRTYCTQIDFQLSESASRMQQAVQGEEAEDSGSTTEDLLLKQLLELASKYMGESSRELHAEVIWEQDGKERIVSATTHTVVLDKPFNLPNFGGGGGSTGGTSTAPDEGGEAAPPEDGGTNP
jgi:prepilin-type N-terminal cleavage/methylation domain-containing protein